MMIGHIQDPKVLGSGVELEAQCFGWEIGSFGFLWFRIPMPCELVIGS